MVLSLRVGLVGAGDAAGHHARALGALHADGAARWSGVCARDPGRLDVFCDRHGAPPDALRSVDLDRFLDPATLDAVVLATPDGLHPAQVALAAARGLHVLVEKPIAPDAATALALVDACRAEGVRLGVGYHLRHHAGHRSVRDNLRALIGPLRHVDVRWAWPDPARDGWRARGRGARWWALAALGAHALDLAQWFAGDGAPTVHGGWMRPASGIDEAAGMSAAFGDDVTAHVWVSVEQRATPRVLLAGLDGELEALGTLGARGAGAITLRRGGGERLVVPFDARDPYEAQLRAFVAAVREGRDPDASGDDGARNVALLEQWTHLARRT